MPTASKPTTTPSRCTAIARRIAAKWISDIADTAGAVDAGLIAKLAEFDDLERRIIEFGAAAAKMLVPDEISEQEMQRLEDEQRGLLPVICAIHAEAWDGLAARARSIVLRSPHLLQDDGDRADPDERMMAALLRDLTEGSAA
jgi:hypothetical protein